MSIAIGWRTHLSLSTWIRGVGDSIRSLGLGRIGKSILKLVRKWYTCWPITRWSFLPSMTTSTKDKLKTYVSIWKIKKMLSLGRGIWFCRPREMLLWPTMKNIMEKRLVVMEAGSIKVKVSNKFFKLTIDSIFDVLPGKLLFHFFTIIRIKLIRMKRNMKKRITPS